MWRDSMRPTRFGPFDGRSVFPLILFAVHIALWTFALAVASAIVFWVLERKGLRVDSALRQVRSWLAGEPRPAVYSWKRRRMLDHG
jgi:intracellular multiplication protein IcmT